MDRQVRIFPLLWSAAGICFATAAICIGAFAQEPGAETQPGPRMSFGAEYDFDSNYVWRGIVLNPRPVMQPSLWISSAGFTMAATGVLPVNAIPGNANPAEANMEIDYDRQWKKLGIEPSLDAFLNRRPGVLNGPDTMEGALQLEYPLGPLHIFTRHSIDVLAYRGAYFGEAGAHYERNISRRIEIGFFVSSGWGSSKFNDVYIGVDKATMNYVGAGASVVWHLTPHLYVQPHAELTSIVDRQLRAALPTPSVTQFGLAMGYEL